MWKINKANQKMKKETTIKTTVHETSQTMLRIIIKFYFLLFFSFVIVVVDMDKDVLVVAWYLRLLGC